MTTAVCSRAAADVGDLWDDFFKTRSETVREELALRYLPLVKHIVNRLFSHIPDHVSREDLVSSGIVGLLEAIQRYEPGKRVSFQTFAYHRVRGAILDELRSYDLVSRTMRRQLREVEEAIRKLEKEAGETPDEQLIADRLGMGVEEYRQLLVDLRPVRVTTFTDLLSANGDDEPCRDVPDPAGFGEQNAPRSREIQDALLNFLQDLPKMERLVISLYYYEQMTMKEIAFVLNLSERRVSQLHTQAILRLRRCLTRMAE